MHSIENFPIRQVQLKQLSILKEIDRICSKNRITYYLISGSTLGAIRHQGFIPWDDDIDIALMRKDYNHFIECCKTQLDNNFFLQINSTDPNYYLGFAKIRINNTVFKETFDAEIEMHHGIFLDIFPLDNISDNRNIAFILYNVVKLLRKIILLKYMKSNTSISIFVQILCFPIILFLPSKIILSMIEKIILFYEKTPTSRVINFYAIYNFKKEYYLKEIYGIPEYKYFEKLHVPIPSNWNFYLTQLFGDYMKLPPLNKRITHNPIEIKL